MRASDRVGGAVPFLRGVWNDFTSDLRSAPPAAQRRLVARLFGGLLVLLLVGAGVARFLSTTFGDGPLPGDAAGYAQVESILSLRNADSVTALGASIFLVPVTLLAAVLAARKGRPERALVVITTFMAGKALTKIGWMFWSRSRPDGVADGLLVPPHPTFPSGHALQAVVIWGLLAGWWVSACRSAVEKTLVVSGALFVTVVAGLTRVRLDQHYGSDVLAAWVFGALWLAVALWAERGFRSALETPDPRDSIEPSTPAGTGATT